MSQIELTSQIYRTSVCPGDYDGIFVSFCSMLKNEIKTRKRFNEHFQNEIFGCYMRKTNRYHPVKNEMVNTLDIGSVEVWVSKKWNLQKMVFSH